MMLILLQNHIIYMPNLPPFSRSERIADYERDCGGVGGGGVEWKEERIGGSDGVEVAMAVGKVKVNDNGDGEEVDVMKLGAGQGRRKKICIVYFQGLVSQLIYIYLSNYYACDRPSTHTRNYIVMAVPSHPVCLSSPLSSGASSNNSLRMIVVRNIR